MSRGQRVGLVGLVLASAVGAGLYRQQGRRDARPRFETARVQRGRLSARVTATGTLSALVTVQVGSQVSGRLSEINVDFNSPVKKGKVIARIDPALFDAAVEQARANLLAAQGSLAKAKVQALDAKRQATRSQTLLERKLIAQADFDTAQANELAAAAQVDASFGAVEQARASLHQAQVNLDYTSIVSPINGTVISRSVDVGQTVAASLQAPTLFTIAEDLQKMQVDTSVAEADVGKLQPGTRASFTVDAYPTERFIGSIRQIRNAPQTVQNVVTYDAVIDVANPELKLRPGMTANVNVTYAERDHALKVPNAALRFHPAPELLDPADRPAPSASREAGVGNQRTLWTLRGGRPHPVTVEVGISDGIFTEVAEGPLQEGDGVITEAIQPEGGKPSAGPGPAGGGPMRRGPF